jgi:hypothetical protein
VQFLIQKQHCLHHTSDIVSLSELFEFMTHVQAYRLFLFCYLVVRICVVSRIIKEICVARIIIKRICVVSRIIKGIAKAVGIQKSD